jgi:hypothetical protein
MTTQTVPVGQQIAKYYSNSAQQGVYAIAGKEGFRML